MLGLQENQLLQSLFQVNIQLCTSIISMERNILAIGGGGFGRVIGDLKIEKYLINIVNKKNPKICFIPTASGDNDSYKVSFFSAFTSLNCVPTTLDFFKRTFELESNILSQDIIYVGGGNTKSMLGVWKEWGLDLILKKAYQKGIVMSGVSAGAICWFNQGITDSKNSELSLLECLNFINGNCCPHYDEESNRRPYVKNILKDGIINECIGIEGNCALHVKNENIFKSINFGNNKNSYLLKNIGNNFVEKKIDVLNL